MDMHCVIITIGHVSLSTKPAKNQAGHLHAMKLYQHNPYLDNTNLFEGNHAVVKRYYW